jgi:hypothetical protein
MKGKSVGILVALAFAVCFGGVGAFASWVSFGTLWNAWEARGWSKVPAEVLHWDGDHVEYRYEVNERAFTGRRAGIASLETEERPAAASRIESAFREKQPLEVLVDPDDPSRSVADATIPWLMVIGFLPFALGFGAVGLGALGVMVSMMLPESEPEEGEGITSDAGSSFVGLAIFTFLWNAIAFPIAGVMVMEVMKSGDWAALFVLLFPLIGLLMIWGTIVSAFNWIRRGGARLHPQQMPPRLGSRFSGHVAFPRGVTAGDSFKAVASCVTAGGKNKPPVTHCKREQQARVADVGGRRRLAFAFDTPDRLAGIERDAETSWQLELIPEGKQSAAFTFHFKMQPPAGVEHLSEEELRSEPAAGVDVEVQPLPEGVPAAMAGVAMFLGKEGIEKRLQGLPKAKREQLAAQLAAMTPEQKKSMEKAASYAPLVKKLVIAVIVLFVLVQAVGIVSVLLFSN